MPSRLSCGRSFRINAREGLRPRQARTKNFLRASLAPPLRACGANAGHASRWVRNAFESFGHDRHIEAPAMCGVGVGGHRAGILTAAKGTASGIDRGAWRSHEGRYSSFDVSRIVWRTGSMPRSRAVPIAGDSSMKSRQPSAVRPSIPYVCYTTRHVAS